MANSTLMLIEPPHHLVCCGQRYRCALGWGGISEEKHEGDGTTPVGRFPLGRVFYRADRMEKPKSSLPIRALKPNDGWCDDPSHPSYNQLVTRPFQASHERLWRKDHTYDLIIELGFNYAPTIAGKGSAIFMHNAQPAFTPTKGCIALYPEDLLNLLETCGPETHLIIPAITSPIAAGQK